jgi:hypothetical protein
MYGHHIWDFLLFKIYLIHLKLNLTNYFFEFKKKWKSWMYVIYLWQNNACHKIWKNCIYISKLRLWVKFFGEFFYGVWYWYTWINLRPFKDLKFLDEISFKKCVFFSFLNNKCICIYIYIGGKPLSYHIGGDFINGHCIIIFNFFCLVMFHEP